MVHGGVEPGQDKETRDGNQACVNGMPCDMKSNPGIDLYTRRRPSSGVVNDSEEARTILLYIVI